MDNNLNPQIVPETNDNQADAPEMNVSPAEAPVMNEAPVEMSAAPAEVPAAPVPTLRPCVQCGMELLESQIFCPRCGQKNDIPQNSAPIAGEVSDAIAQFNQGIVQQATKKKKKTKVLIVVLVIVALLIAAAVGGYTMLQKQADIVIDAIRAADPVSTTIQEEYETLTPIGQLLFREKIVKAFADEVSDHAYTTVTGTLVNTSALDRYATYKRIGEVLNITSEDGTNVMEHIDAVLKLNAYVQYNGVYKCVTASVSSYSDCLDYISDATDYSSYYLVRLYLGYAYTSAKNAYTSAKTYSVGDTLCTKYVNALNTMKQELYDLYYDVGYYSSSSVSSAMTTISGIVSDVSDAKESVEDIVESIPDVH